MLHQLLCHPLTTKMRMHHYTLDIAHRRAKWCRWQHEFGFCDDRSVDLSQENKRALMRGRIDGTKVFLHVAVEITYRRGTEAVEIRDGINVILGSETHNQRLCRFFVQHGLVLFSSDGTLFDEQPV